MKRADVRTYDAILRYLVPSRSPGVDPYLVELNSYDCNGECQCKHFACRLEPLLKQGMTPRTAVESGLAEIPPWGTVEDALRCFHIHVARLRIADDVIRALAKEQRTNEPT